MSKGLLVSASFALLAIGCDTVAPTSPLAEREAAAGPPTSLVASPLDPRLPAAASNPVLFWNELTTEFAEGRKLPPPLFSRAYALVHAGISDALATARDGRRGPFDESAVAAGVAYEVLRYLFPEQADRVSAEALAQASLADGGRGRGGWAFGRAVGRLAVERGKKDGSDATFSGPMPAGPGIWTGTNPVLPLCGTWKCWLIPAGAEFHPDAPYPYGSAEDLREVDEIYQASLHRTQEQIDIVHKWADRLPPVIWNALLVERLEATNADPVSSARALAWLHMTMADAFISCWSTKYTYWVARPFQRIPGLVTVIPTPNFPSYTSGHSTVSAAAAEMMGEFFPGERDYFVAQAEEAAISRFWGGIHFTHDDDEGLEVGRRIGAYAVTLLRRGKPAVIAAR